VDEITRPPRMDDLVKLCVELNRLGARYIVIGGIAMNNLRLVRRPKDRIDLQYLSGSMIKMISVKHQDTWAKSGIRTQLRMGIERF
jgi:hypothetical protein